MIPNSHLFPSSPNYCMLKKYRNPFLSQHSTFRSHILEENMCLTNINKEEGTIYRRHPKPSRDLPLWVTCLRACTRQVSFLGSSGSQMCPSQVRTASISSSLPPPPHLPPPSLPPSMSAGRKSDTLVGGEGIAGDDV